MQPAVLGACWTQVAAEKVNRVDRHLTQVNRLLALEHGADERCRIRSGFAPHTPQRQVRAERTVLSGKSQGDTLGLDCALQRTQLSARFLQPNPDHPGSSDVRKAACAANSNVEGPPRSRGSPQRLPESLSHFGRDVAQELEGQMDAGGRHKAHALLPRHAPEAGDKRLDLRPDLGREIDGDERSKRGQCHRHNDAGVVRIGGALPRRAGTPLLMREKLAR